MPVRTVSLGTYEIVTDFEHDAFARSKLLISQEELQSERALVQEVIL